ncbi:hypothetical protein PC123_g14 [Phytophthora cactorum]|nr:hypothetical protein PC123_g14 [Phytophthora cactorum]
MYLWNCKKKYVSFSGLLETYKNNSEHVKIEGMAKNQ